MSVYEAMSRKKILENKIKNTSTIYRMVDKKLKSSTTELTDGTSLEDAKTSIKAAYDSTVALIENYTNLTAALHESNAKTTITIGDKTMTVAEAIGREKYLDFEERVYTSMVNSFNKYKNEVDTSNERKLSPEAISSYVEKILGDSKKDTNLIAATEDAYRMANTLEVFDPLNTKEIGEKKLEELKAFKERLHFELTNVNCKTNITVNFVD